MARPTMLLLLLCLSLPQRAEAQTAGERAVLRWSEQEVKAGRTAHALRGLLRAARKTPTPELAERYALLALPWTLPNEARERARMESASERLLALLRDSQPPLAMSADLALRAAWALAWSGDFAAARELVASAGSSHDPQTLVCLRHVAGLAIQRDQLDEAQASLALARGFAPSDPALAGELGLTLLRMGEAARAVPVLAERFAADRSLTARRDFAYALLSSGRASEAYQLLQVEREACSAQSSCLLELARSALEARRYDDAVRHAEQLASREPPVLDGLFVLAEAHTKRADVAAARATYQRILRLSPGNLRARAALEGLP